MAEEETDMGCNRTQAEGIRRVVKLVTLGLFGLAIGTELRKPADQREWRGEVLAVVPYNFNRPTLQTVHETLWAPQDPHIFKPRIFGIGWDVNFGRLWFLISGLFGRRHEPAA